MMLGHKTGMENERMEQDEECRYPEDRNFGTCSFVGCCRLAERRGNMTWAADEVVRWYEQVHTIDTRCQSTNVSPHQWMLDV